MGVEVGEKESSFLCLWVDAHADELRASLPFSVH